MNRVSPKSLSAVAGLVLTLLVASDARPQSALAETAPKKAEEVFENIQVLKGVPADQVIPIMHTFSASLGVDCNFCHESEYAKEGNPEKLVTRKMVQMMRSINNSAFDGRVGVTCYSCHHGSAKPVEMPPVSSQAPKPVPAAAEEVEGMPPGGMPSVDQVLDKYVTALGGTAAVQKVSTLVAKGTVVDEEGHKFAMEIFAKAPDKRVSITHLAKEDSFELYNGDMGWTITPNEAVKGRSPRDIWREDLDALKLIDPVFFAGRVKQVLSDVHIEPIEQIDGREMYVVSGLTQNQALAKLYFDKQSGMLVRLVHYRNSPVGTTPLQIEYADYRDVDGVKRPFRWTIDEPRGLQPRFTYQLDAVQQNVPIDDSKFAMPAACRAPRCSEPGDFKFGLPGGHVRAGDNTFAR